MDTLEIMKNADNVRSKINEIIYNFIMSLLRDFDVSCNSKDIFNSNVNNDEDVYGKMFCYMLREKGEDIERYVELLHDTLDYINRQCELIKEAKFLNNWRNSNGDPGICPDPQWGDAKEFMNKLKKECDIDED